MSTRDDIHKLRQALDCACKNNESNITLLDNIYFILRGLNDITLKANWIVNPGNNVVYTYDANNNVTLAEYYEGATLVFTQAFTYDANNNCTSIITT
jgi:hypothetical protein